MEEPGATVATATAAEEENLDGNAIDALERREEASTAVDAVGREQGLADGGQDGYGGPGGADAGGGTGEEKVTAAAVQHGELTAGATEDSRSKEPSPELQGKGASKGSDRQHDDDAKADHDDKFDESGAAAAAVAEKSKKKKRKKRLSATDEIIANYEAAEGDDLSLNLDVLAGWNRVTRGGRADSTKNGGGVGAASRATARIAGGVAGGGGSASASSGGNGGGGGGGVAREAGESGASGDGGSRKKKGGSKSTSDGGDGVAVGGGGGGSGGGSGATKSAAGGPQGSKGVSGKLLQQVKDWCVSCRMGAARLPPEYQAFGRAFLETVDAILHDGMAGRLNVSYALQSLLKVDFADGHATALERLAVARQTCAHTEDFLECVTALLNVDSMRGRETSKASEAYESLLGKAQKLLTRYEKELREVRRVASEVEARINSGEVSSAVVAELAADAAAAESADGASVGDGAGSSGAAATLSSINVVSSLEALVARGGKRAERFQPLVADLDRKRCRAEDGVNSASRDIKVLTQAQAFLTASDSVRSTRRARVRLDEGCESTVLLSLSTILLVTSVLVVPCRPVSRRCCARNIR